jgi:RNA-dependent RNA polymerase
MQKGQVQGQSQGLWYRQTDIVDRKTREELATTPVMNRKETPIVDIGHWTTYRITFNATTFTDQLYATIKTTLADHGIHITTVQNYLILKGTAPVIWSLLEEEISGTHPHLQGSNLQESAFQELATGQVSLGFDVRYQLEVCLSNGILQKHSITRAFLERLASMSSIEAINLLEKAMNDKQEYFDPMAMFSRLRKPARLRKLPSYCVLSRSANITPTLIHVGQPAIETSNRIIRKHLADVDRFIRVRFTDEKTEGDLFASDNDSSDAIFDRVTRAMNHGVVVAGRYYEFLAFGNSQFRERGAYFYAPTPSKSAEDIRRSMGKFDHIMIAAKYGARLGQCFSTTRAIKSVNVKIEEIEDVKRNGYCFTDGVGKISTFLAQMAAKELGLPHAFHDPPSLYQFRLAGCKGVLALDPSITGHVVHIRPSQYKFEAQNVGLEIIRASALSVATFNRQLIVILSTLGVPDAVFIQKQQEMVNDLEKATKEEDVALEKLQRNIDLNQTTLTMAGMVIDGFMQSQEPFMMSLLQLWRAYHIKYLKERARIMIEEGAYVLGCVDETATLRGHYDDPQSRIGATREEKIATLPEIFLQITDTLEDAKTDKKGHYKVIQGLCILARNPSLHAGDVRVVLAVDVPALHHLKDVVVLPQTGDRDIPNMCSGGDLDGDDYIVLWDKDFLPETINDPPMDFTAEKPTESTKPITVKDITDFFVTHMKNDSLGRIANAHMAQADISKEGVRDRKCTSVFFS